MTHVAQQSLPGPLDDTASTQRRNRAQRVACMQTWHVSCPALLPAQGRLHRFRPSLEHFIWKDKNRKGQKCSTMSCDLMDADLTSFTGDTPAGPQRRGRGGRRRSSGCASWGSAAGWRAHWGTDSVPLCPGHSLASGTHPPRAHASPAAFPSAPRLPVHVENGSMRLVGFCNCVIANTNPSINPEYTLKVSGWYLHPTMAWQDHYYLYWQEVVNRRI